MKLQLGLFFSVAMAVLLSISAPAQLTIDATGPHKEPRKTSGGRGGGIGRKLPLSVAVEVTVAPVSENGKTIVEFFLTNSGKEGLRIPISPDDLEPAGSQADYSFKLLSLYVTSDARRERILPGGAHLYGNDDSATLITLAPGEAIRVRAKVALPPASGADKRSTAVFVAHAMLADVTITTVNGKSLMDVTEDLGSAKSPEYTLEALYKSAK
jgi:hypothetical protein